LRGECRECGKALLPTAAACPYCGAAREADALALRADLALQTLVGDPDGAPPAADAGVAPAAPPERRAPGEPTYHGPVPRAGIAALLSAVFPGAGQAYTGHLGAGVALGLTWWLAPVLTNVLGALHAAGAARRAAGAMRAPRSEWAVLIAAFEVLVQAPILALVTASVVAAVLAPRAIRNADEWTARQLPAPQDLGEALGAGESALGRMTGGESAPGALPIEMRNRLADGVVLLIADKGDGWVGEGTGVIVSEDGLVVTNAHVAEYGESVRMAAVLHCGTQDSRIVPASLVRTTPRPPDEGHGTVSLEALARDLALVRIDGSGGAFRPLTLGRSSDTTETAGVYAVGFPLGTRLSAGSRGPAPSFARGSVTRLQRDDSGRVILIEHSAPILEGYSGGPLVTRDGTVVGVNAGIIEDRKVAGAVPAERAADLLRGVTP
jgi:S1-C subfamily serine protease